MYHQTLIQIEVLSEHPIPDGCSLESIVREIDTGDYSGNWRITQSDEVDQNTMADLLRKQGSDPEFLGIAS